MKGRVDHKEAGKTCLVVQSVEAFAPTQEEIERARAQAESAARAATTLARPVHLRVGGTCLPDSAIEDLKQAIEDFPGAAEVLLDVDTSAGTCRLRLGEAYRVAAHADAARRARARAGAGDRGEHRVAPASCERCAPAAQPVERAASPRACRHHRQRDFLARWPRCGSRLGSRARTAAPGTPAPRGTRRSRPRRARPRRCWRGGRGWSRAGSASRSGAASRCALSRSCAEISAHHARRCRRACGCHSRRRTGGRSPGRARAARSPPAAVEQRGELVDRATERAAGAGGVLEVQRAALALAQRLADRLAGARDRLGDVAGLGRAGVQDHRSRADRLPDAQRVGQRRERLGADLARPRSRS